MLEILQKVPYNENLRPYVKNILAVMVRLLQTENEDNAVIAIKIAFELHRQYRTAFGPDVCPGLIPNREFPGCLCIQSSLFVFFRR